MASVANTISGYSGGDPNTVSLTVSAGTSRKAVAVYLAEAARTFSAVTFNGNAMTEITGASIVHSATVPIAHMYYYDIPDNLDAGNYTVSFDLSSSTADDTVYAWQLTGVATGAPEDADEVEVASSTSTTISRTLTTTTGAVVVAAVIDGDPTVTLSWTAGVTERFEGNEANMTTGCADEVIVSGGSTTVTATHSTNTGRKLLVTASFAAQSGPTINTQPTAVTTVLAGPVSNNPATFTTAATTSGGSLTYDWELETSVGGGVYANLADGNGATWTGQTSASCSATITATTLSGRRVRCNVTDDNGTTTTDAVALTIYAGTTIAQPAATDGSGVATAVLTTDVADTANGPLKLITFTKGATVLRTTARKTS